MLGFIENILKGVKEWTEGLLEERDYVTASHIVELHNDKADKVSSPTSGNFAGLDANGNITDSGSKASDFATAVQGAKADTALQSFTETDPTVPSWAKASSKPTYTAQEVGALPSSTVLPVNAVSKTYSELVTMKTNGTLVPGTWYRMTDFVTTVPSSLTDVQSAGHAFDLLLLATDTNKFDIQAKAIQHSGDTYFSKSRLDGWQLWYDINNDTTTYEWADATNGKGIIIRMIDEWNNDHPFDFKNLMFRRYKLKATKYVVTLGGTDYFVWKNQYNDNDSRNEYYWLKVASDNSGNYKASYDTNLNDGTYNVNINGTTYTFQESDFVGTALSAGDDDDNYPFADLYVGQAERPYPFGYAIDQNDSMFLYRYTNLYMGQYVIDNSLGLDLSSMGLDFVLSTVYENKSFHLGDEDKMPNILSGDSLLYVDTTVSIHVLNGIESVDDILEMICSGNTFDGASMYHTFYGHNACNYIGIQSKRGLFGEQCFYNRIGSECHDFICGNSSMDITCGNYCDNWTCGNYCSSWTCGNYCSSWTCGNYCDNWTCGNNCSSWTCGNYCYSWECGNYCYSWECGNDCKYFKIIGGVHSQTLNFTPYITYQQVAALKSNGTLVIYNPADLA